MTRKFPILRTAAVAALMVSAAGLATAATSQESSVKPGYWELVHKAAGFTVKKELRCVSPADVDKILNGPSNRQYKCEYPDRKVGGGKIALKGHCVSKKGRQVEIEATGSYSPTAFSIAADIDTVYAGVPLGARLSTTGKRLGDVCPAEAKRG